MRYNKERLRNWALGLGLVEDVSEEITNIKWLELKRIAKKQVALSRDDYKSIKRYFKGKKI